MNVKEALASALRTTPHKYQVAGVRFFERSGGRALCCDDMGLGKTLQALGWAAIHPELRPVVIVCPASVKFNWQRELHKHAGLNSYVCDGIFTTEDQDKQSLKKSLTKIKRKRWKNAARLRYRAIRAARKNYRQRRSRIRKLLREVQKQQILILNYDIVESWLPLLLELNIQLLLIDECHYVKNRSASRTKACRVLSRDVPHLLALSGTPISGKPSEFFPILQMIRPREFNSFWQYAFKYCAPTRNRWSGGWNFDGASNLDHLHKRLKKIMIRRMKREVLKELPKKTRSVLPVEIDNRTSYTKAEKDFLSWLKKHRGEAAVERARRAEMIVKLNALKLLSAEGKLDTAIEWIRDWLVESNEKLIVFGFHKRVLKKLKKAFPGAAYVDGSVSAKKPKRGGVSKRQQQVDRFKKLKSCRIFIGHTKAAGQGIDGLQVASTVLFLEIGWTPGEHEQAEDRALRIGQRSNVSVYYMVGHNTVEEKILRIIQDKDDVVSRVLDGRKTGRMGILKKFLKQVG